MPDLRYDRLSINEGGDASLAFEQLIYDLNADKEEIRRNLLQYCRMDTLGDGEGFRKTGGTQLKVRRLVLCLRH